MKPWIAIALLAATIALAGCKNRREEPVPGPKATPPAPSSQVAPGGGNSGEHHRHGVNGISWFQDSLEEAFSTTCPRCTAMLRR